MNGCGLLLLVAALGQVGSASIPAALPETDFGWEVHQDGVLEYIIQVSPDELEMLTKRGQEKTSLMPPELVGRASRIVVRIGSTVLPRTPSLKEIEQKFPIVGTPESNAKFPATPPGFSASNMKNVEPPTVYNVGGTPPPALPNSMGSSSISDRSLTTDQSQRLSSATVPPSIPSLSVPDSSLLAQNSSTGSGFLDASRNGQASSRQPAAIQNSDKYNSPSKQPASQIPSRAATASNGSVADATNRNWSDPTQMANGGLPNVNPPNSLGGGRLSGTGGLGNQYESTPPYAGTSTQSGQATLPSYGQASINNPNAAAERWPGGNSNGQLVSQPFSFPNTQPTPQSPIPTFGSAPNLPGTTPTYGAGGIANSQGQFGGLNNGGQNNYPQTQGYGSPGLQGSQYPASNHTNNLGFQTQPQYDPRLAGDYGYVDRVAMNANSVPNSLPTNNMSRSGDGSNASWQTPDLDRPFVNGRTNNQVTAEPVKNVDGILQVFFLLSLVVNFYLGLLIRKLLARYRSLLSSVRSQTT